MTQGQGTFTMELAVYRQTPSNVQEEIVEARRKANEANMGKLAKFAASFKNQYKKKTVTELSVTVFRHPETFVPHDDVLRTASDHGGASDNPSTVNSKYSFQCIPKLPR